MAKDRKLTFEQALAKLEEIVQQIEQGQVSLEESISKYAEGTSLIRQCRTILESAEKKIQVLSQNNQGELSAESDLEDLGQPPCPDETGPLGPPEAGS